MELRCFSKIKVVCGLLQLNCGLSNYYACVEMNFTKVINEEAKYELPTAGLYLCLFIRHMPVAGN